MIIEFKLKNLSGHAKEGKIGNVHIKVGDRVEKNDVLFEIETNKGNVPVKSDIAGEIAKINVESGIEVKIGDVLATIDADVVVNEDEKNEPIEFKLQSLSGQAKEGKVGNIHVNVGDKVEKNDVLFEIETNKGNVPVKSDIAGEIAKINVESGVVVKIGDVLAIIEGKQTGKADSNVNNKSNVDKKNTNSSYSYLAGLMKPVKKELESDIVIIGGGPGGYVAAIQAAKMGANVIVVEMDKVGGTCLNRGCIPTKSLVRSAEVFKEIKEAENFGIAVENATISMKKVIERKNNIVKQLVQGIEYLLDKNNIKVIKGKAEIQDKETVLIKDSKQETIVKSKNIIIATGSETAMIPIPGVNSKNVLTSTQALELEELPAKIVIIGGGVIGMEFAFIYANMGVEVAVVEFMDDVCFTLDDDTIELIAEIAKDAGIKIHTSSKVESIMDTEDGQSIVSFVNNGEAKYIAAEKVLLSVGRVPFCEGLGLENVGIELNKRGKGIKVNDKMQT
ncbi:MAG: FAD-dependent oxidoreductase, partial [Eubacteriales bacterium]